MKDATVAAEPRFPSESDVIICGNCGQINQVKSNSLVPMLEADFNSLSAEERSDIAFAVRDMQTMARRLNRKVIVPDWFK